MELKICLVGDTVGIVDGIGVGDTVDLYAFGVDTVRLVAICTITIIG